MFNKQGLLNGFIGLMQVYGIKLANTKVFKPNKKFKVGEINQMRIGIPRALLYHFYKNFWQDFFKNLDAGAGV